MIAVGIDVSKLKLHLTALLPAGNKRKTKTFSNQAAVGDSLVQWCCKVAACEAADLHVAMEATGIYHLPIATALADAGVAVSICNPAQIKEYRGSLAVRTKQDRMDSYVLACFVTERQPRLWVPAPPEVRKLKALAARLVILEKEIGRENNRLEKAQFAEDPQQVVDSIQNTMAFLKSEHQSLLSQIDDHIDGHPRLKRDRELLRTIPAVAERVSMLMLIVIHSGVFNSARQLAAYLGLVPVEHSSGSSVWKRPHLSKAGNPRIRARLYMAAVCASQYNPDVRAHYQRLVGNGMPKKAAIGAAMRKLVHICFGVIKNQTPYVQQVPNIA
jgi:transposase